MEENFQEQNNLHEREVFRVYLLTNEKQEQESYLHHHLDLPMYMHNVQLEM